MEVKYHSWAKYVFLCSYLQACEKIYNIDLQKSLCDKIIHENEIISNNLYDLYYMILAKEILTITTNLTKKEKDILSSAQIKQVKSMEEYKQLIIIMKKLNIPLQSQQYCNIIKKQPKS